MSIYSEFAGFVRWKITIPVDQLISCLTVDNIVDPKQKLIQNSAFKQWISRGISRGICQSILLHATYHPIRLIQPGVCIFSLWIVFFWKCLFLPRVLYTALLHVLNPTLIVWPIPLVIDWINGLTVERFNTTSANFDLLSVRFRPLKSIWLSSTILKLIKVSEIKIRFRCFDFETKNHQIKHTSSPPSFPHHGI